MRIGIVGATGQVGGVMRGSSRSASSRVDELRLFASARSAGRAALEGRRGHRRGRRDRRLRRARHRPVLRRRRHVAGAGAEGRRGRRRGDRQLVGVADGPRGAAGRRRGQPPRARHARKGIIANPNCTTMAAMPVLKPLHDEAGLRRAGRRAPTRRSPAAGWPASPSWTSRSARWPTGRAALDLRRRARSTSPRRSKFAAPIAFNVLPLAGIDRRRRLGRDRRGAEAAQREPQDPRHPRPAVSRHLRARAGVHRPLAVDQRRVRPADLARARAPSCSPAPRASSWPTSRRRCRRPAGPDLRRAHPRRRDGASTAWRCSCSNDNLRKGAALNAVQIAELLLTEK